MTPTTSDRPQMSMKEFEEPASHAPEMVRLEFVKGKVQVKSVPDGNDGAIVAWLLKQCMQHRPELFSTPSRD